MTTAMYDAREAIIPGSVYDRSSQGEPSWQTPCVPLPRSQSAPATPDGWVASKAQSWASICILPSGSLASPTRPLRAAVASANGLYHGPSRIPVCIGCPVLLPCILLPTCDLSQSGLSFRVA